MLTTDMVSSFDSVFECIHELPRRMMSNTSATKFFLTQSTIFHNRFTSHNRSRMLFGAMIESSFVLEVMKFQ